MFSKIQKHPVHFFVISSALSAILLFQNCSPSSFEGAKFESDSFSSTVAFSPTVNEAGTGILENPTDFADVCSVYRQYKAYNANNSLAPSLAGENCALNSGTNGIGADIYSKPSVTRAGWIDQTCLNLVENSTTLQYALNQVDANNPNPDLNYVNMLKIFKAFYRDRPDPSAAMLDSLLMHADPANPLPERWKAPIYAVCTSSYWQVL
jgi:hypothetical protein